MGTAEYKNIIYSRALHNGATDIVARCIVSQSMHETGNFSSSVLHSNNNLFGMRMPSKRKTPYILGSGTKPPASEGSTPYARYATLQDSVDDLFNWFQYNNVSLSKINGPSSYDAMLSTKGYHAQGQDLYTAALVRYFDQLKTFIFTNPHNAVVAVLFAIAAIYLLYKH